MGYRFEARDPGVGHGVRRIACEQIDRAIAEIDAAARDREETVHQVRKRAKKLRGLIRLVRPRFADYKAENAAFRDAAKALSGMRDRDVLIETHDELMAASGGDRRRFAPVRARLTRLRRRAAATADPRAALAGVRDEMAAARDRAMHWSVEKREAKAFAGGLAKTWKRARRAMEAAAAERTDTALHEWRKRVKDHWYHARLLKPVWDGPMAAHAGAADDLAEMLGDHHDLAVYRAFLAGPEAPELAEGALAELDALAATRQEALSDAAFGLGRRLFAEPDKALTRRWTTWWRLWRAEAAEPASDGRLAAE